MNKIFVTGLYGSGKTTFAKKHARKNGLTYVSFDQLYNYQSQENQAKKILNNLPDSFIMDAIPFNAKTKWKDFFDYIKNNQTEIICVYCPDRKVWLKRIGSRAEYYINKDFKSWLKYEIKKCLNLIKEPLNIKALSKNYRDFYTNELNILSNFKNIKYYDALKNEYTTREEMLERINSKSFKLEERLDAFAKEYDCKYQDIEIIDMIGYSESYRTWKKIKNLVRWRNKTVCDLGCFHGYFSFKAEDKGASITGLDASEIALETAEMINDLRGGKVVFRHWIAGEDIPKCDVILCLNVFHHFKNKEKALSKMKCQEAIFEIYKKDKKYVEKYFNNIKEYRSHRKDRVILLCQNQ